MKEGSAISALLDDTLTVLTQRATRKTLAVNVSWVALPGKAAKPRRTLAA
jgi:hypothetical protein